MAIPYRTAKFKSANILAIAILGSTAKFNARQYFRLYGSISIMCQVISLEDTLTYTSTNSAVSLSPLPPLPPPSGFKISPSQRSR